VLSLTSSNFQLHFLARRPAAPLRNARWKGQKGDTIADRAQHWSVLRGKMLFVNFSYCLPVLLDVERPLELQVLVLVVVGEHGGGLVVATAEHAGRRGLGLDWNETNIRLPVVGALGELRRRLTLLLVFGLVGGVGRVRALV